METKLSILVTAWITLWVVRFVTMSYFKMTLGENWRDKCIQYNPRLSFTVGFYVIATIAYTIYVILAFAWGW